MVRSIVVAVSLLALVACDQGAGGNGTAANSVAPVAATPPPAGTDWVSNVVRTPEGGFRMGNPNAQIKLIEYGSVTCPHCAAFSQAAAEPLKSKYIANGKVSYEFRSFLIHGQDVAVTIAAQCGGPVPFFTILEQLYADQDKWMSKLVALSPAEQTRIQGLPIQQQIGAILQTSGVDAFVEARGVGKDQLSACLADKSMPDKLLKIRDQGTSEYNLAGTPTFIINGKVVPDVTSWDLLEPKLREAGA